MNQTFYEYMMRFADSGGREPLTRLANTMRGDIAFPKQSDDFNELSSHLESHSNYSKLLVVFDDAWSQYQSEK